MPTIQQFRLTQTNFKLFLTQLILIGILLILAIGCRQEQQVSDRVTLRTYSYATPVLGVVTDENLQVVHIEPGSAAEKAGLQVGDELKEIDGVSIKEKTKEVKKLIGSKEKLQLKFKRKDKDNGQDREVEVEIIPGPRYGNPEATVTPVFAPQDYF